MLTFRIRSILLWPKFLRNVKINKIPDDLRRLIFPVILYYTGVYLRYNNRTVYLYINLSSIIDKPVGRQTGNHLFCGQCHIYKTRIRKLLSDTNI